jgi:peptide/nickel transport system substrate-binding protein
MGVPRFAQVEARFIPELAARVAAVQTGDVDMITPITPDDVAKIQADPKLKIVDFTNPATVHMCLPEDGPTKDQRVRQAMNMAIDKDALVKNFLLNQAVADGQLIGPNCLGYNPDVKPYPFDLAKAKQMMADAGFANGFNINLIASSITPAGKDVATTVSAQLAQIGVKTTINVLELAVWIQLFYAPPDKRNGIFTQILNWDQTFEPNATWRFFSTDLPADAGRKWNDDKFNSMYQAAKATIDKDKRTAMYKDAGKYLHDLAPVLFLWQLKTIGVTKATFKNWNPYPVATEFVGIQPA